MDPLHRGLNPKEEPRQALEEMVFCSVVQNSAMHGDTGMFVKSMVKGGASHVIYTVRILRNTGKGRGQPDSGQTDGHSLWPLSPHWSDITEIRVIVSTHLTCANSEL